MIASRSMCAPAHGCNVHFDQLVKALARFPTVVTILPLGANKWSIDTSKLYKYPAPYQTFSPRDLASMDESHPSQYLLRWKQGEDFPILPVLPYICQHYCKEEPPVSPHVYTYLFITKLVSEIPVLFSD